MRNFLSCKKAILGAVRASPRLMDKMFAAQNREREQVLKELVKVRGLMPLLMKLRNGKRWTNPEQNALREQLRALANLSPYLAVMVLPGSFVVLPALAWWLDRRRQIRKVELTVL
jgi:hypothetical protein